MPLACFRAEHESRRRSNRRHTQGRIMTSSISDRAQRSRWQQSLLLSTSLVAVGLMGAIASQPAAAQDARPGAALPPVYVGSPDAPRVRRAPAQRTTAARRSARTLPVARAPQPEKLPPSVNNQDARTGQVGYITNSVTSATKTK